MLNEFYRVAFRRKLYATFEGLQADLDTWMREYNDARPHQGRWCLGKTPLRTFLDRIPERLRGAMSADPLGPQVTFLIGFGSGPSVRRPFTVRLGRLEAGDQVRELPSIAFEGAAAFVLYPLNA